MEREFARRCVFLLNYLILQFFMLFLGRVEHSCVLSLDVIRLLITRKDETLMIVMTLTAVSSIGMCVLVDRFHWEVKNYENH